MAVTVVVEVAAGAVALAETMAAVPTLAVDAVGVGAAHRSVSPQLQVHDESGERTATELVDLLAGDPTVTDATMLSEAGDAGVVWLEWAGHGLAPPALFPADAPVAVDSVRGREGDWRYELVCVDEATLSELNDHWDANDLRVTVRKIVTDVSLLEGDVPSLSDVQAETLQTAYRRGYYEIPRRTKLADLSSAMDVSHQALSERLRRAHGALVADQFERDDRTGSTGEADSTAGATASDAD